VLLDDVVVVEQPLAGRSDVYTAVGGRGQPGVRILQDSPGAGEPVEERGPAPGSPSPIQPLARGESMSPLAQVLGAEQLAPNGASQQTLTCVGAAGDKACGDAGRLDRSDGANSERVRRSISRIARSVKREG
jgi:hypothetical protein